MTTPFYGLHPRLSHNKSPTFPEKSPWKSFRESQFRESQHNVIWADTTNNCQGLPGLASSVACASVASQRPVSAVCVVVSRTAIVGRLLSPVRVVVKFAAVCRRLWRTSDDASDSQWVKCCRASCQKGWMINALQLIRLEASLVSRPSSRLWNSVEGLDDTPDPTQSYLIRARCTNVV